jgi:hypothetical protein
MSVHISFVFVLSYLAIGLIPVQGVLPTFYKTHISRLILTGSRPENLIRTVQVH